MVAAVREATVAAVAVAVEATVVVATVMVAAAEAMAAAAEVAAANTAEGSRPVSVPTEEALRQHNEAQLSRASAAAAAAAALLAKSACSPYTETGGGAVTDAEATERKGRARVSRALR